MSKDIILLDKPASITSFDCIRLLRRRFPRGTKLGHAGTLDPMATGLMLIGVGEGTKRLHGYLKLDKTYEADILLGIRTATGDVTGKVLESQNTDSSTLQNVPAVLRGMVGKLKLPVPAYSAIKQDGEPLYKKARRGEAVDAPIKTMEVKSVEFLGISDLANLDGRRNLLNGMNGVIVKARFDVASGTYVRSLAEELGRRLCVPATLAGLRRTRIGEFRVVEDARKL